MKVAPDFDEVEILIQANYQERFINIYKTIDHHSGATSSITYCGLAECHSTRLTPDGIV